MAKVKESPVPPAESQKEKYLTPDCGGRSCTPKSEQFSTTSSGMKSAKSSRQTLRYSAFAFGASRAKARSMTCCCSFEFITADGANQQMSSASSLPCSSLYIRYINP